jgi:hypothetical protein
MIKKILFETLQRFDLKDANELQEGVLEKLKCLAEGVNINLTEGIPRGGPLSKVSLYGVSDGVVRFKPMTLLTAEHDVLCFDQEDVDNGILQVDISAVYADWLAGNQNTGIYFYAYPQYTDGDTENREFYSVIDNAPTTRQINTRRLSGITFFANLSEVYNIQNEDGYYPIYIGYVKAADISTTNSSSPFNPTTEWNPRGYFDSVVSFGEDTDETDLPNVANNRDDAAGGFPIGDLNGRGLSTPFHKIERQLARIVSYGTQDSETTNLLGYNQKPEVSLQGLRKLIEGNLTTINKTKYVSGMVFYSKAVSTLSIVITTDSDNDIPLELYFDYKPVDDANPGVVSSDKTLTNGLYSSTQVAGILTHINARFGGDNAEAYNDWIVKHVEIMPVSLGEEDPYNGIYGSRPKTGNASEDPVRAGVQWYQKPNNGFEDGISDISAYTMQSINRLSPVYAMGNDGVQFVSNATIRFKLSNHQIMTLGNDGKLGIAFRFTLLDPSN